MYQMVTDSFLQEIASMDADTTSALDDRSVNGQPDEAVSSTTENAAEGYEAGPGDHPGSEGT